MSTNIISPELLEHAIESLEIKLAYQEDTIEMLNQTVISQQKKLNAMEDLVNKLAEKIKSMPSADAGINNEVELPPHY